MEMEVKLLVQDPVRLTCSLFAKNPCLQTSCLLIELRLKEQAWGLESGSRDPCPSSSLPGPVALRKALSLPELQSPLFLEWRE